MEKKEKTVNTESVSPDILAQFAKMAEKMAEMEKKLEERDAVRTGVEKEIYSWPRDYRLKIIRVEDGEKMEWKVIVGLDGSSYSREIQDSNGNYQHITKYALTFHDGTEKIMNIGDFSASIRLSDPVTISDDEITYDKAYIGRTRINPPKTILIAKEFTFKKGTNVSYGGTYGTNENGKSGFVKWQTVITLQEDLKVPAPLIN